MEDTEHIEVKDSIKELIKRQIRRSVIDRRTGEDKRSRYNLDYFTDGGEERRKGRERRKSDERRSGWVRVTKWCSVFLGTKFS